MEPSLVKKRKKSKGEPLEVDGQVGDNILATVDEKRKKIRHVHFDEETIKKSNKDEAKTSTISNKKKAASQPNTIIINQPVSRMKNLDDSNGKKTWLDNTASETKNFKTGKFSREELKKLMQSICEYVSVIRIKAL
jgi:hypothetical protein